MPVELPYVPSIAASASHAAEAAGAETKAKADIVPRHSFPLPSLSVCRCVGVCAGVAGMLLCAILSDTLNLMGE